MLNIVIPMAGRGSRFSKEGYKTPKPLLPIHGRPMTEVVINNLRPSSEHKFHFLILREHAEQYQIDQHLKTWAPGCEIIFVEQVTEGAACTVLLARDHVDNDNPMMIANCDQYVDVDMDSYLSALEGHDGLIMTMWADDPKWSFVRFDEGGKVVEVVEKKVVSNEATVGIYNFARGSDFVRSADRMIEKDLRVNGEFYVAPAYNEMIGDGARLTCSNIGKVGDGMYGIGVPVDFEAFVKHPISEKAVRFASGAER